MGDDHRADEIKQLARRHAETAIKTLVEVAEDDDAKSAARVMAAKTLLERGFGAPERKTETKVDVTLIDQRQAHLEALQRLAARKAPAIADQTIVDADWSETNDENGSGGTDPIRKRG